MLLRQEFFRGDRVFSLPHETDPAEGISSGCSGSLWNIGGVADFTV